ncbi:MAG: UvrB/UvrC motif-containing protein [Candidatus Paceibacterota bacterium]|jgi:hypothetical protein
MKIIKIKKDGKILLEEHENELVKVKKVKSLKGYLACEIEFEKGLTFGTFFGLLLKEKDFFDDVFTQELKGKKLKEFEDELKGDVETYQEDFKLDCLEISKIFEFFTFEKGSTIDLFSVFIGIGKTTDEFDVFIPLSFCSVNELKDLKLLLNKIVEVYKDLPINEPGDEDGDDDDEIEDGAPLEEGEMVPFFEAATRISLYEAIQCILYEISYYETREERINARKNQNNEQINKNKIFFLEAQLTKHIENEEFEKAAVVKREIDRIKATLELNKN